MTHRPTKHAHTRTPTGVSGNPAKRAAGIPAHDTHRPITWRDWVEAARPRTLPLAVTPVLLGAGAAVRATGGDVSVWLAVGCLAVALFLQIGVNFANDYSDGIRGTDRHRAGPPRLVGSGRVEARIVLTAALVMFALAAVCGAVVSIASGHWWFVLVGAAAIAAAWFYTGGTRPYGYMALGELFVFVFFGLVATLGTSWVLSGVLTQEAWFAAIAAGLFAVAVLLANNLRDIDQDRAAGKRTLTTVIGARGTRMLYSAVVLAPFAIAAWLAQFYPMAALSGFALLAAIPAILIVWTATTARELVLALALTSVASLIYAAAVAWAFIG